MVDEAGFWLRRKIDGSYDEVWTLFSRVMSQFDSEWFEYLWEGWEYYENGYYAKVAKSTYSYDTSSSDRRKNSLRPVFRFRLYKSGCW